MNSQQPNDRAETLLKKKQERLREGQLAMAEYQAENRAVGEKTARLRALRLARDAAEVQPDVSTAQPAAAPIKIALPKKTALPKKPPRSKTVRLAKKTKKRSAPPAA